jgi:uncharacterized OB-fold protein
MSHTDAATTSRTSVLVDGQLMLRYCDSCHASYAAWLSICSSCMAADLTLRAASGHGRLNSWVVYQRQYALPFDLPVPYTVLAIDLHEGPRVNALLAPGQQMASLRRDLQVELDVDAASAAGRTVFRLAESNEMSA